MKSVERLLLDGITKHLRLRLAFFIEGLITKYGSFQAQFDNYPEKEIGEAIVESISNLIEEFSGISLNTFVAYDNEKKEWVGVIYADNDLVYFVDKIQADVLTTIEEFVNVLLYIYEKTAQKVSELNKGVIIPRISKQGILFAIKEILTEEIAVGTEELRENAKKFLSEIKNLLRKEDKVKEKRNAGHRSKRAP